MSVLRTAAGLSLLLLAALAPLGGSGAGPVLVLMGSRMLTRSGRN